MSEQYDQMKWMIEFMGAVLNPVNQTLTRHSETVNTVVNLVQRLMEVYTQEPTRNTIINTVRAELDDAVRQYKELLLSHESGCRSRNDELNTDAIERSKVILEKCETLLKQVITEHHEKVNSSIVLHHDKVKEILKPVDELKARFNWLLWSIGFCFAVGSSVLLFLYPKLMEAIHKFEAIEKLVPKT